MINNNYYKIFVLKALLECRGEITGSELYKLFKSKCEYGSARLLFDDYDFSYDKNKNSNIWGIKINAACSELIKEAIILYVQDLKGWKFSPTGKHIAQEICCELEKKDFDQLFGEYQQLTDESKKIMAEKIKTGEQLLCEMFSST
jgi:hypothetical protein